MVAVTWRGPTFISAPFLCVDFGHEVAPLHTVKIVVEKHDDGYVAYPLGIDGVVVGEGDSFDEALADVKSSLAVSLETFGAGSLESASWP